MESMLFMGLEISTQQVSVVFLVMIVNDKLYFMYRMLHEFITVNPGYAHGSLLSTVPYAVQFSGVCE